MQQSADFLQTIGIYLVRIGGWLMDIADKIAATFLN